MSHALLVGGGEKPTNITAYRIAISWTSELTLVLPRPERDIIAALRSESLPIDIKNDNRAARPSAPLLLLLHFRGIIVVVVVPRFHTGLTSLRNPLPRQEDTLVNSDDSGTRARSYSESDSSSNSGASWFHEREKYIRRDFLFSVARRRRRNARKDEKRTRRRRRFLPSMHKFRRLCVHRLMNPGNLG